MAGTELRNYGTGHKTSNQQSEKPDLPQHKPGSPWENCWLLTTSQLHLFCTAESLLSTIVDPASWWLSQSCDSYAAAFGCRDVGPDGPKKKHSLAEHLCHVASTTSTVASLRVAKLGWLPSQAKLPKCQSNNQIQPIIPNTNLDRLGKTGRYLQLRSFAFFALHYLYSGSCAKVVSLTQPLWL